MHPNDSNYPGQIVQEMLASKPMNSGLSGPFFICTQQKTQQRKNA